MKNTIYSILAVVACVILANGCSEQINPVENNGPVEVTLSANLNDELTKTAVDGTNNTKINWIAGDKISVWGDKNSEFTLYSGQNTTNGSFRGTVSSGSAQYAMYPYSASATINAGVITTKVPNTQTVPLNSFDPAAAIIVGTISGTTINFKHALAYLKITAPSDVTNLIEITIESNGNVQLTGDANFNASTGAFTATGMACNLVTIKPESGSFKAGGIYYAAVIPGTYTGGLTVKYIYKNDTNHKLIGKSKKNTTSLTLSAGTAKLLGAATLSSCTTSDVAVQLWSGGPYWATYNLGAASSAGALGQYFAWGYPSGQTAKRTSFIGALIQDAFDQSFGDSNYPFINKNVLEDSNDMAAVNWGTGWRLPTNADFLNLIENSKLTTVKYSNDTTSGTGLTVTGKGEYASNSIFLIAAGFGLGTMLCDCSTTGLYWSRTQTDADEAYNLSFSSSTFGVGQYYKNYGLQVRPVRSSL